MASEYAIRLKATLDTSSIQSELQKLRTAQQGGAGNGASGQGAGGGSALGGLGNTLSRLNNSIASLQKSIDALSRERRMSASSDTGMLGKIRSWLFGGGGGAEGAASTARGTGAAGFVVGSNSSAAAWRRKNKQTTVSNGRVVEREVPPGGIVHEVRMPDFEFKNFSPGWQNFLDPWSAEENRIEQLREHNPIMANAQLKKLNDRQRQIRRRSMTYWMAGMQAQALFQQAADISRPYDSADAFQGGMSTTFSALGAGLGTGINTASTLMQAGASAGSVAGLSIFGGLAAGAAAVVGELNKLAQQAAETALAIEKQKFATTLEARGLQRGTSSLVENWNADVYAFWSRKGNISREDMDYVLQQSERYDKLQEDAINRLADMKDPLKYATQRRNAAEMEIATGELKEGYWHPFDSQEINRIREIAEDDIKQYLERYKNMQSEFKQLNALYNTWEEAKQQIEDDMMRFHNEFEQEYSRFENEELGRVQANFDAQQAADEVFGIGWARRGQRNALQGIANDILMNRTNSPRSQFNQLSQLLSSYRNQRNEALNSAYKLNKQILAGGLDEIELGELQKRRGQEQNRASHLGDLITILENALRQIDTTQWKPNLQNLTSLSQFGFNMGENDDAVQIMERYWERHINLTREIKLEIQKGVKTEAVYN